MSTAAAARQQRIDALERANRIRHTRAQVKRDIRDRLITAASIVANPAPHEDLRDMRVVDVAAAQWSVGPNKAPRMLRLAAIPENATLADLTPKQRGRMVDALEDHRAVIVTRNRTEPIPNTTTKSITRASRKVLQQAEKGELRRVHRLDVPGADPWPASPPSLHALERHGFLRKGRRRNRVGMWMTTWSITEAGMLELHPPVAPVAQAGPNFLNASSAQTDYTASAARSLDTDPCMGGVEAIDADRLSRRHRTEAQERHAEARGAHDRARQLAQSLKAA